RISERRRQHRAYQRGDPQVHHHLPDPTAGVEPSDLDSSDLDSATLPPDVAADLDAWPPEDAAC
ncbi:MAG: hypothetical protein JNK56_37425, partial [Myxococcales bacterium]|nr:hypothetical protein [Myxococcales bacterium]